MGTGKQSGTVRVTESPAQDPIPLPIPVLSPPMLTKIFGVERSGSLSLGMMRM